MHNLDISNEEKQEVGKAEQYLQIANENVIDSEESFNMSTEILQDIKKKKNEFDDMRKKLKAPINQAAKTIEDFFRKPINYLGQAETIYKANIIKYQKSAETLNADIKSKNIIESEKLTEKALGALKENDYTTYADSMHEISKLQSNTLTLPKNKGVSFRDNWKGRVTNFEMLVQAVVDKKIPISVLQVDKTSLTQLARSVKNSIEYPGVEFYNDKIVSVKSE